MASAWNLFVKKIYFEGKSKDKNYSFGQALKDASKRKSEMSSSSFSKSSQKTYKSKSSHKRTTKRGGKSRKRHRK